MNRHPSLTRSLPLLLALALSLAATALAGNQRSLTELGLRAQRIVGLDAGWRVGHVYPVVDNATRAVVVHYWVQLYRTDYYGSADLTYYPAKGSVYVDTLSADPSMPAMTPSTFYH